MVGDGACNDETNTAVCNYDGGDCCLNVINTDHCSECTCYMGEFCATGFHHPSVGDGSCNDDTNIVECGYDGGDCCLSNVNTDHCSECTCYHQETCAAGFIPSSVGDGFCNDETNIVECNYDGGDCCVNVNTDLCSNCLCSSNGVITSPGFPGNYDSNLYLTWLIQVPVGQFIEIVFVSFDTESW